MFNWVAAFCAAEKTEEKNPELVAGEVRVPPGVFASSNVGVSGLALMALASLLEPIFAGFLERKEPDDFAEEVGDSVTFGKSGSTMDLPDRPCNSCCPRVGVGGVTSVEGGGSLLGGVSGLEAVLIVPSLLSGNFGGCSDLPLSCSSGSA